MRLAIFAPVLTLLRNEPGLSHRRELTCRSSSSPCSASRRDARRVCALGMSHDTTNQTITLATNGWLPKTTNWDPTQPPNTKHDTARQTPNPTVNPFDLTPRPPPCRTRMCDLTPRPPPCRTRMCDPPPRPSSQRPPSSRPLWSRARRANCSRRPATPSPGSGSGTLATTTGRTRCFSWMASTRAASITKPRALLAAFSPAARGRMASSPSPGTAPPCCWGPMMS